MYCLNFRDIAASLASGLCMTHVCFEPSQFAPVKLEPTPSEQLGNVSCIIRAGDIDRKLPLAGQPAERKDASGAVHPFLFPRSHRGFPRARNCRLCHCGVFFDCDGHNTSGQFGRVI